MGVSKEARCEKILTCSDPDTVPPLDSCIILLYTIYNS